MRESRPKLEVVGPTQLVVWLPSLKARDAARVIRVGLRAAGAEKVSGDGLIEAQFRPSRRGRTLLVVARPRLDSGSFEVEVAPGGAAVAERNRHADLLERVGETIVRTAKFFITGEQEVA